MRFLKTTTLSFEEIPDSDITLPQNRYAILSHRWFPDEDEVTYDDVILACDLSERRGWAKIKGFCELV
ncbi:hypothetical protein BU24DRAFT_427058, partial [Aaosphaeria arxii CBS 175.79]